MSIVTFPVNPFEPFESKQTLDRIFLLARDSKISITHICDNPAYVKAPGTSRSAEFLTDDARSEETCPRCLEMCAEI